VNRNVERGKRWERAVVDVLKTHGHPYAERALGNGAHVDRGDVIGVPGFYFDAKDCAEHKLAQWLDEVVAEAVHRAGAVPVLVVKRKGVSAERAYAVLELATFAEVIASDAL